MRILVSFLIFSLAVVVIPTDVHAQKMQEREEDFLRSKPLIGDKLPDLTVYLPDGTPLQTSEMRGHYTVLTFGCLT